MSLIAKSLIGKNRAFEKIFNRNNNSVVATFQLTTQVEISWVV